MNLYSIARLLRLDRDVKPSDELKKSAKFIRVNPKDVIVKARLAMFLVLITSAVAFSLIMRNFFAIIASIALSLLTYYYITERPKVKAREERLRGLSHAPEIITVLGTSLELNPSLERAVRLIGEACEGRISKEFSKAYKKAVLKGESLKESFNKVIKEWGEYSEGFRQGMNLINAGLLERETRGNTIERGMNAFFNNLLNEFRGFLAKTKTHTLVLFSFGTVIPLIIISLLPVINLLNNSINPLLISGFLLMTLLAIHYYSSIIIKNRPATFSQVSIGETKDKSSLIAYSLVLFFIISSPTLIYFTALSLGGSFNLDKNYASMPLILGFSVSISAYYYLSSKPYIKARNKAIKSEKELLNITYSLGNKLQEKRSFEDVLKQVVIENKGKELTSHLSKANQNIKELRKEAEEAVMKELKKTGSNRVISVFKLVFHALRQGVEKSARNIFKIYEHFSNMTRVEEEHKSLLEQVLSMMKLTAVIFAPLISAFIVLMQGMIEANITSNPLQDYGLNLSGGMSLELMQLVLGLYSIGLVIVLTNYYVRLKHGPDKTLLRFELSKNVITACLIYLTALIMPLMTIG